MAKKKAVELKTIDIPGNYVPNVGDESDKPEDHTFFTPEPEEAMEVNRPVEEENIFNRFKAPPKEEEEEKSSSFNIPSELIAGGIPLLVGALMGKPSIGAKVGGETINDMMNKNFLLQKQAMKSRSTAAATKIQPYRYFDEKTGTTRYAKAEDVIGKEAGYSKGSSSLENLVARTQKKADIAVDTSGRKLEQKGSIGDVYEGMPVTNRVISDSKDAASRYDKITSNQVTSVQKSSMIRSLLKEGVDNKNVASYQAAIKEFAKVLEGGGKLTDFDVNFVEKRLSLVDSLSKRLYNEKTGEADPDVAAEIFTTVGLIEDHTRAAIRATAKKLAGGYAQGSKHYDSKLKYLMNKMNLEPRQGKRLTLDAKREQTYPYTINVKGKDLSITNEKAESMAKERGWIK